MTSPRESIDTGNAMLLAPDAGRLCLAAAHLGLVARIAGCAQLEVTTGHVGGSAPDLVAKTIAVHVVSGCTTKTEVVVWDIQELKKSCVNNVME